jgi:hypothetical protein|tara:strand:+ start:193 stop:312 length:120 start_codon:yes stop_codon:yes gene_type:complete
MNQDLNNFLDKLEGRKKNDSNKAINKERKKQGYKIIKLK